MVSKAEISEHSCIRNDSFVSICFSIFANVRVCKTYQKPCMTAVSLERSRWRDTVEIRKCCNVLGEQRIMDFFKRVKKAEK